MRAALSMVSEQQLPAANCTYKLLGGGRRRGAAAAAAAASRTCKCKGVASVFVCVCG